jgi:hypothetical protein
MNAGSLYYAFQPADSKYLYLFYRHTLLLRDLTDEQRRAAVKAFLKSPGKVGPLG